MLTLLLACAADITDSGGASVTWYRDVQPILQESCTGCHTEGGIAPFPLTTYDEVVALSAAVSTAVTERTMPPWGANSALQDYLDDPSLSDDEIATITDWVAADMPRGDPAEAVTASPLAVTGLERVDVTVEMPQAYAPDFTDTPDVYRCFVMDWPHEKPSYITGVDVDPGSDALVHHVIAYMVPPDDVETFTALDEDDPGEGYSCYGGPGGTNVASWIGGWVPGKSASMFPDDTGVAIDPGSAVIFQVHYNDTGAETEALTALDLTVEDTVLWPGGIQPITDLGWVYGDEMVIPAGGEGVSYSTTLTIPADLGLYSAGLHMHTLGQIGRLWVERASGEVEWLVEVPRWDFSWQQSYWLAEPISFQAGDAIGLECVWDNPGDEDVGWGEGTDDEMCLGMIYMTSRK